MSFKWLTEPESLVLLSLLQYGMMSNEASESVSGIQCHWFSCHSEGEHFTKKGERSKLLAYFRWKFSFKFWQCLSMCVKWSNLSLVVKKKTTTENSALTYLQEGMNNRCVSIITWSTIYTWSACDTLNYSRRGYFTKRIVCEFDMLNHH